MPVTVSGTPVRAPSVAAITTNLTTQQRPPAARSAAEVRNGFDVVSMPWTLGTVARAPHRPAGGFALHPAVEVPTPARGLPWHGEDPSRPGLGRPGHRAGGQRPVRGADD